MPDEPGINSSPWPPLNPPPDVGAILNSSDTPPVSYEVVEIVRYQGLVKYEIIVRRVSNNAISLATIFKNGAGDWVVTGYEVLRFPFKGDGSFD